MQMGQFDHARRVADGDREKPQFARFEHFRPKGFKRLVELIFAVADLDGNFPEAGGAGEDVPRLRIDGVTSGGWKSRVREHVPKQCVRVEEKTLAIDARPSDSIALAVRTGAPVFVAEDVMDSAAVTDQGTPGGEVDEEAELQAFREFLEHVDPEDFQG